MIRHADARGDDDVRRDHEPVEVEDAGRGKRGKRRVQLGALIADAPDPEVARVVVPSDLWSRGLGVGGAAAAQGRYLVI